MPASMMGAAISRRACLLRKRAGIKRLRQRSARLLTMDEDLGTPRHFAAKRLKGGELLIVATNEPATRSTPIGGDGKSNACSATAKPEASIGRTPA